MNNLKRLLFWVLFIFICFSLPRMVDKITFSLLGYEMGRLLLPAFIILSSIYVVYTANRSTSAKTLNDLQFHDASTPIPKELKVYHEEIIALGFELAAECSLPSEIPLFSARRRIWLYLNPERTIVVWLHRLPRVDFDTYFQDGFQVSTQYPKGELVEDSATSHNIIATSVAAAFDYHLHNYEMQEMLHGQAVTITDLQIIRQQEVQMASAYRQHMHKKIFRGVGSYFGQLAILMGLIALSSFYTRSINPDPFEYTTNSLLAFLIDTFGLLVVVSPFLWFIGMIWYNWRNRTKNTVEARKAKIQQAKEKTVERFPFD